MIKCIILKHIGKLLKILVYLEDNVNIVKFCHILQEDRRTNLFMILQFLPSRKDAICFEMPLG